jgi:hypothetical protein
MRSKTAFLAGIGTAYFFDPQTGKKRRHEFRDRSLRAVRQLGRLSVRKAKFAGGHVEGLGARARNALARRDVPTDDATVAQRIRSDALRDVGVSTRDVDVTVEGGFARLRGSVPSVDLADRLVRRVRKIAGVQDVSAELRVADEQ